MVGWNVAGFDRRFLRRQLPLLNGVFSYRTLDLNAVVFAMTEAGMHAPTGRAWTYDRLKRDVKTHAADYARTILGYEEAWHAAGYDALCSLLAYERLRSLLRPSTTPEAPDS